MTDEEIIEALQKALVEAPDQPYAPRFSGVGKCARARGYHGLGVAGAPGEYALRSVLAAAEGNGLDAALGAALYRGRLGRQQVPVTWTEDGVSVSGSADAVLTIVDDVLIDWKRAGSSTWREAGHGGKAHHVAQVNAYAYALGRARWWLVYIHAEKPDQWRIVKGQTDPAQAIGDLRTWVTVEKARERGELVPRPDARIDECRFCPWANLCWSSDGGAKP